MVIKLLTKLGRLDEHSENFNKETENVRKHQTEVITALKSIVDKFNSRMKKIEEQITELEDKETWLTQTEQQNLKEKKKIKWKNALWGFWDNIKQNSIHIIGVPEEEEKEKWPQKVFEIIILKTALIQGRKQTSKSRSPEFQNDLKPKEILTKTHYN